jgi:hypothetical protein
MVTTHERRSAVPELGDKSGGSAKLATTMGGVASLRDVRASTLHAARATRCTRGTLHARHAAVYGPVWLLGCGIRILLTVLAGAQRVRRQTSLWPMHVRSPSCAQRSRSGAARWPQHDAT